MFANSKAVLQRIRAIFLLKYLVCEHPGRSDWICVLSSECRIGHFCQRVNLEMAKKELESKIVGTCVDTHNTVIVSAQLVYKMLS